MPKTKLLKLIYILEEESILKSGEPFTDLKYEYWAQGPVSGFVHDQIHEETDAISDFLIIQKANDSTVLSNKLEFDDSEFSAFDIELMDFVIERFGNKTVQELVDYTHREGSLWFKKHKEHNGQPPLDKIELDLMELLNQVDSNSDLKISAQEAVFFKDYIKKSDAQA